MEDHFIGVRVPHEIYAALLARQREALAARQRGEDARFSLGAVVRDILGKALAGEMRPTRKNGRKR